MGDTKTLEEIALHVGGIVVGCGVAVGVAYSMHLTISAYDYCFKNPENLSFKEICKQDLEKESYIMSCFKKE